MTLEASYGKWCLPLSRAEPLIQDRWNLSTEGSWWMFSPAPTSVREDDVAGLTSSNPQTKSGPALVFAGKVVLQHSCAHMVLRVPASTLQLPLSSGDRDAVAHKAEICYLALFRWSRYKTQASTPGVEFRLLCQDTWTAKRCTGFPWNLFLLREFYLISIFKKKPLYTLKYISLRLPFSGPRFSY